MKLFKNNKLKEFDVDWYDPDSIENIVRACFAHLGAENVAANLFRCHISLGLTPKDAFDAIASASEWLPK